MSARDAGPANPHLDRTRARAWALQVHYRWEAGGHAESLSESLEQTRKTRYVAERRVPYIERLVTTIETHLESIDRTLEGALENWTLGRLASIDRGVLRIGAAEMLHFDDVPPKVSLKEAIRLAERYGGDESAGFVNGVLDALLERTPSGG